MIRQYLEQIDPNTLTILVIEDNVINLKLTTNYLAEVGFRVLTAQSGESGLKRAQLTQPDLILLDVQMPGIDGFETCRRLKADEKLQAIPVIFMTALTELVNKMEAFNIGAVDYVTKPIEYEELLMRVVTHLHIRELAKGLERKVEERTYELSRAYETTIAGWGRALEMRDDVTEGHSQRVMRVSVQLAQKMGVAQSELIHIQRGALLHDVGKMGVPDKILRKPGTLTEEEMALMRQHPQLAYNMLKNIDFLQPALDIPRYHHEWWDGTGYNAGLKGEEIPFSARIFSIVDTWDALATDRPYRKAWKIEDVLAYIQTQSGKQFDPAVVVAFIEMMIERE